MTLPPSFLDRPLAHRGLHAPGSGRLENCRAAFVAAAEAGYGIELDVRLSRDGAAVVFHDSTLDRLSGRGGVVSEMTAADLSRIPLQDSADRIETLRAILDGVSPETPVLVELKPDGADASRLAAAVAAAVEGRGNVAVMSFGPTCMIEMARCAPRTPRGLTTSPSEGAAIRGFEEAGACFLAHDHADLDHPDVARLKGEGAAILSWTIRSEAEAHAARRIADTVIFEDYLPARSA